MPSTQKLRALAARWTDARAAERANAQSYIIELCDALEVEPPRPAGSGYEFELPVKLVARDGSESQGFVDCYKAGHFVLEAKDFEEGRSNDVLLRKAYGQARTYAAHDPSGAAPPYLLVLDVGKTLLVWDRWAGTFGGYAAARRVDLARLHERPEDAALLADIWANPAVRDPRTLSQAVTRDIAAHLAELAAALEDRGLAQERVARFLMRAVFTMFAEDVGLLPDEPFRRLLHEVAIPDPAEFPAAAEDLWRAMDEGRRFGFRKLLRFNGHFFQDAEALPLTRDDLAILLEAAKADWSKVEPTIFGTLLTRALDADERHRLGAEYTPPEFIERLIRPTIEEPVRERWTAVQAEVLQLRQSKKTRDRDKAEQRLLAFHAWLRSLKVLDPACGSGNFLYLAMHALKRVEVEVLHELADVRGGALELRMEEVDPSQFYGIEVKPWAREIAELTLWIGFHQFWRQHHQEQPAEPLLRDTGTLECRDAVLAWDARVAASGPARPDPTPRQPHPVTGRLVPDPDATLPDVEYVGARPAEWPPADFIVGNPPFLGKLKQREALGDGYVAALRSAYPGVPDAADLVMYWWAKAAEAVAQGRTLRAGLITTNSITQSTNRPVVATAAERGARVTWAIADHYWNDGAGDARVRVAMTVVARAPTQATLVEVDGEANVVSIHHGPRLNLDLTVRADVAGAAQQPLTAARGVSSLGFMLAGAGFQVDEAEARRLLAADPRHAALVRPLRSGKDVTDRPRPIWVIDFGLMTEEEARAYPVLYDIVRDRVRPERAANPRPSYAMNWWRFAEPRREWRAASAGLARYLVTPETSKHRIFVFADARVAASHSLVCIGLDDPFALGVLSSRVHATWALAAGARMGIDATPRYNKSLCFESFPFPSATSAQREAIGAVAERIHAHRDAALAASPKATLTALYNVVDKLRAGAALTLRERDLHTATACATLRDLHDELDRLVADAYGWTWPESAATLLERLVALHDERVAEEAAGVTRWLRPDYQSRRFGADAVPTVAAVEPAEAARSGVSDGATWPADAVGQITALRHLAALAPVSVEEAVARLRGAPTAIVARHLETLELLGEVRAVDGGRYAALAA